LFNRYSLSLGERAGVRGMKRTNINRCRILRKKQTEAEKKLWSIVRNRQLGGIKFRRQFSIGRYILDFYCPKYLLGIAADGGQHNDDKGRESDGIRTKELKKFGVEIIRFSDREVLTNIEGVYEVIRKVLEKRSKDKTPHLNPLPPGERR